MMGPTSELSPVPEGLPFGKSLTLPPTALSAAAYHGLSGAIVRRSNRIRRPILQRSF